MLLFLCLTNNPDSAPTAPEANFNVKRNSPLRPRTYRKRPRKQYMISRARQGTQLGIYQECLQSAEVSNCFDGMTVTFPLRLTSGFNPAACRLIFFPAPPVTGLLFCKRCVHCPPDFRMLPGAALSASVCNVAYWWKIPM